MQPFIAYSCSPINSRRRYLPSRESACITPPIPLAYGRLCLPWAPLLEDTLHFHTPLWISEPRHDRNDDGQGLRSSTISPNHGVLWLRRNYPAPLRSSDNVGHPLMAAPALYPGPGHCIDPSGTRVRLEGFSLAHKANLARRQLARAAELHVPYEQRSTSVLTLPRHIYLSRDHIRRLLALWHLTTDRKTTDELVACPFELPRRNETSPPLIMVLRKTPQNENISYGGCGMRGPPAGFLAGFSCPMVVIFSGIPAGRLPRGTPVVTSTTCWCDRNPAAIGPTSGVEAGSAVDLHDNWAYRGYFVINRHHRHHPSRDQTQLPVEYKKSPQSDVHGVLEAV